MAALDFGGAFMEDSHGRSGPGVPEGSGVKPMALARGQVDPHVAKVSMPSGSRLQGGSLKISEISGWLHG